jgi:hypothetical protein
MGSQLIRIVASAARTLAAPLLESTRWRPTASLRLHVLLLPSKPNASASAPEARRHAEWVERAVRRTNDVLFRRAKHVTWRSDSESEREPAKSLPLEVQPVFSEVQPHSPAGTRGRWQRDTRSLGPVSGRPSSSMALGGSGSSSRICVAAANLLLDGRSGRCNLQGERRTCACGLTCGVAHTKRAAPSADWPRDAGVDGALITASSTNM